jgi:hypothetical protein
VKTWRQTVFATLAGLFFVAAGYHLFRAFVPEGPPPAASPARHLVFVAINGLVAVGLLRRPALFVAAFACLTVQQIHSHGGSALAAWTAERRVDWLSIGVVVVVLATCGLLVDDLLRRRKPPPIPPGG